MREVVTGEFMRTAEEIAAAIDESDGVTINDLSDIIRGICGPVNLYPSNEKGYCHPVAFFVSLNVKKKGQRHLNFNGLMNCFVQHMQGHCPGITRRAVLITDMWNPVEFEDWKANVERVKMDATVEAYVINGKTVQPWSI